MTLNEKKKRLIPVILIKNGWVVQSVGFKTYKNIGHPIPTIKRLSDFGSDELILLDITKNNFYETRREDMNYSFKDEFIEILKQLSEVSFMPVAVGGKISNINDALKRIENGAEKIIINTMAFDNKNEIKKIVKELGNQAVVLSVDYKKNEKNEYKVVKKGNEVLNINALDHCKEIRDLGVGEIFLNSVDRDGKKNGYEIEILKEISEEIKIPIIACGGAGSWSDMYEVYEKTDCDGIAASNIFHHIEHSVFLAKEYLHNRSNKFRSPKFEADL